MATSKPSKSTARKAVSSSKTSPAGVVNVPEAPGAQPYELANKGNLASFASESPADNSAEAAAAAIAGRSATLGATTGLSEFDDNVATRESDVLDALNQRNADVRKMHSEEERRRNEEQERRDRDREKQRERTLNTAMETRVPVTEDTVSPVGPGPARPANRVPGTGVADPKDLAPGQDLRPSPPGGVSITPLPDKPGTKYSAL